MDFIVRKTRKKNKKRKAMGNPSDWSIPVDIEEQIECLVAHEEEEADEV